MRRAVLDASVVLTWFAANDEPGRAAARAAREAFESGALNVVVPPLLALEVLNVAGRKWRWDNATLVALAAALDRLPWRVSDPPLSDVAAWTARGLTAYDAAYVALAEKESCVLVTDDAHIVEIASPVAVPLVPG